MYVLIHSSIHLYPTIYTFINTHTYTHTERRRTACLPHRQSATVRWINDALQLAFANFNFWSPLRYYSKHFEYHLFLFL